MRGRKINVVSAALIYIIGSFFTQGLRFITLPIFSHVMSTSDFGLYSSFETWTAVITVLIGLQTTASVANAYVDFGKEKIQNYVYSVSLTGTISALVIWIVLFIFRSYAAQFFEISFGALTFGVVQCLFTYFFTILISEYRMLDAPFKYLAFSIGNSLINIVLAIVFVFYLPVEKYLGRVYASTIAAVTLGILALIIILKTVPNRKINQSYIRYALKLCSPLIFHAFAAIILSRCDQMMILKINSSSESGIYSYGNNFAHIIYVLYTACNQAFIPWYYKKLKAKKTDQVVQLSKNYMILFTAVFLAFIYILPEFIKLISGEAYYGAIYTAPVISLAFYINFLYTFPVNYEFFQKKTKYIATGTVFAACLNALFNYLFIPRFGSLGAASATALSYLTLLVAHLIVANKVVKGYEMPLRNFCILGSIALAGFLLGYINIENILIRFILLGICGVIAIIYLKKVLKQFKS